MFFGLPHTLWIPKKLNLLAEDIPLGIANILLIIALFLWVTYNKKPPKLNNPIKSVTLFIMVVVLGVGVAAITSFEKEFMDTLVNSKRELSFLLLYFIPLAIIKNQKSFSLVLIICLFVHFLVAIEVIRSGVLGGSAFHDGKRGSGPFGIGWGWEGADVAAGYLAQTLMFYLAFFFGERMNRWVQVFIGVGCCAILLGLYATYARGALLSAAFGGLVIVLFRGLKLKYLIVPVIVSMIVVSFMPASVMTRFYETKTETGELDEGTLGRLVYYSTALEIFKDYPIVGIGTAQIRPAMEKHIDKYVDPHNGILYTACEYGVIGLVVFLTMLLNFATESRRILRNRTIDPIYRNYALGMIGMVATLLVCNMFYANFYKDLVLGSLMIHFGMLASITAMIRQDVDTSPRYTI